MSWILYGCATKSGGAVIATSSAGGATTATSSSGGGSTQTSSSGGGVQTTTEDKTFIELHDMTGVPENSVGEENWGYHKHEFVIGGEWFTHDHEINIPPHSHDITIPNHTHSVSIPAHTHSVDIPAHTHEVTIPEHTHEIDHGIYELEEMATAVTVKVDGQTVPGLTATSVKDFNLIPYLAKDADGKVKRGEWHTVEIYPDKLARINANISSRLFIQSRIGGNF